MNKKSITPRNWAHLVTVFKYVVSTCEQAFRYNVHNYDYNTSRPI